MIQETQKDISYATELKHFEDTYQALMAGYAESPASKREVLDLVRNRLEAAKDHFYQLNEQLGEEPEADPLLDQLLEELRRAFRGLFIHVNSGPPLA